MEEENPPHPRYYVVTFGILDDVDNMLAVFSSYEKAWDFCQERGINMNCILGVPVNEGFTSLSSGKIYN